MTLDQFVQTYNNQFVDIDHAYSSQCWDLAELYAETFGVPKEPWAIPLGPMKAAYEAWTVPSDHMSRYFDRIEAGSQIKGDINVYGPKPGFPDGHICIDLGNGQVFQQNASQEGSPSHIESRSTSYLLGALRIKGAQMTKEQADKIALFARLLQFLSVDQANAFNASDTSYILKDPYNNIGQLLEDIKNSKEWQDANNKKVAYEKGQTAPTSVLINGKPWKEA